MRWDGPRRVLAATVAMLAVGAGLAGCGSAAAPAMPTPTYASTSAGPLSLSQGWVSAVKADGDSMSSMPGMSGMAGMSSGAESAAYVRIHNAGSAADALVGVSTPAAAAAGLHKTVSTGGGTSERMVAVHSIKVPAGGTLTLAPGGYHVMLTHLSASFAVGTSIRLTWHFRSGRTLTTSFPVIDPADRPEETGS